MMNDEVLEIEKLQSEAADLMQEMLLKHHELDAESFRLWWEEEGREKRYFSLRFLSYAYEEETFHEM